MTNVKVHQWFCDNKKVEEHRFRLFLVNTRLDLCKHFIVVR